jgi:hypothetical protein
MPARLAQLVRLPAGDAAHPTRQDLDDDIDHLAPVDAVAKTLPPAWTDPQQASQQGGGHWIATLAHDNSLCRLDQLQPVRTRREQADE